MAKRDRDQRRRYPAQECEYDLAALHAARMASGLSAPQLAERAGVGQQWLESLLGNGAESRVRSPGFAPLMRVCRALGLDPRDIEVYE